MVPLPSLTNCPGCDDCHSKQSCRPTRRIRKTLNQSLNKFIFFFFAPPAFLHTQHVDRVPLKKWCQITIVSCKIWKHDRTRSLRFSQWTKVQSYESITQCVCTSIKLKGDLFFKQLFIRHLRKRATVACAGTRIRRVAVVWPSCRCRKFRSGKRVRNIVSNHQRSGGRRYLSGENPARGLGETLFFFLNLIRSRIGR